jgi:gliding motility associated protien GldN
MRTISVVTIALFTFVLSISRTTLAQDTKPEVYDKIQIPKKKPIPYPFTREADVMWSKIVWRMIDLREKLNLPMYYPLKPIGERMNLIHLIFSGIDNEGLQAYQEKDDDEFKLPMSKADLELNMGNVNKKEQVVDTTGATVEKEVAGERKYEEVKKILIKEKWFFDKSYSTMQVRVIGLCPIRVYKREIKGAANLSEEENADMEMKQVCWIYYPEARPLFARTPIFNSHNDAQQISYDDLFMQRRFSSYIFKESNVYGNRRIDEYTTGIETLLEGERIKESISNFEQDLWEY